MQELEKKPSTSHLSDIDQENKDKALKHVQDNSINARNVLFKKPITEEE